ncbi:MAG: shikimate kinase [Deltaproteobacteria bacterium]|nr:shikimate kinase [Deltaproteobacteria bacterium]
MSQTQGIDHRNIVLIGHRCSGKSSVGRQLAQKLKRQFVDTDTCIEKRARCTIEALVLRHGWDHFRTLEAQVIREISTGCDRIIATGGGAVMEEANVKHLRKTGWIIWLQADAAVLKGRMAKDRNSKPCRPPLTGTDPLDEIADLVRERTPFYEKASDLTVDTTHRSVEDISGLITDHLARLLGERDSWIWAAAHWERCSG